MEPTRMLQAIKDAHPDRIATIDSHTAGEPTRLIVSGIDPLPAGTTMQEKRAFFMQHYDHIRRRLTREPRGHRDMFAAFLTPPVTPGARFGLIYMDPRRFPFLCGHATMGAVMTMVAAGAITVANHETTVIVDTPSGPMETTVYRQEGRIQSIGIRMVPSFVLHDSQTLDIPELGPLEVATVCVGGFFVMVSAQAVGLAWQPENRARFIDLGMKIIDAANQQLVVRHPTRPEVNSVDVAEFYLTEEAGQRQGRSMVVYGEAHMDRSPCGTGTAAKMTLLHHRRQLDLHEPFVNTSPLGTQFEGRLLSTANLDGTPAVVAEIRGSAHITGIHEFILDPDDPFQNGYLL